MQWDTTYGSTSSENGGIIIPTLDGNFIIGSAQVKVTLSTNYPQSKPHFFKVDTNKGLLWEVEHGPARYATALANLFESSDGSIIAAGVKAERNGTPYGNGWPVAWFMKLIPFINNI